MEEKLSPLDKYSNLDVITNIARHNLVFYSSSEEYADILCKTVDKIVSSGTICVVITEYSLELIEKIMSQTNLNMSELNKAEMLYTYTSVVVDKNNNANDEIQKIFDNIKNSVKGRSYFIIGRIVSDIHTENGIKTEMRLEHECHDLINNRNSGNVGCLCMYNLNELPQKRLVEILSFMVKTHNMTIF